MNLYLQFLTQNQTAEVAHILKAMTTITGEQSLKGRLKLYAQGVISRSSFAEVGALVSRLAKKRFNKMELMLEVSRIRIGGNQSIVNSVECTLSVSPTCALWFPVKEWRNDGDRSSDNRYLTAESQESALAFHHISKGPSIFGIFMTVTTKMSQEELLDELANRLAESLSEILDGLHLFGCCDIVEPIFIPQLDKCVVMPQMFQIMMKLQPAEYQVIGERFDDLHALMFGSRRLCKGISDALGKEAKLKIASQVKDFAVLRLAPTCDKESAKNRAADWLISSYDNVT